MDTTLIEKLGTTPVDAGMKRIAAISSRNDLVAAIAWLEHSDGLAPYGISPGPDAKNSNQIIANAGQGGLNLPDRDVYLKPQYKQLVDAYVQHVENMFKLLGDSPDVAKANAQTVLKMETKFAEASMDNVTQRDPNKVYNIMTLDEFKAMTPNLDWDAYLAAQGAPPIKSLNVAHVDFFKAMNGFFDEFPVSDWKTLLRWRLVHTRARTAAFAFSIRNLGLLTKYRGADPESDFTASEGGDSPSEFQTFAAPTYFILRLNLGF